MQRKCPLCDTSIKKGDIVSIVSENIECISDDGDYNYIPDFLYNEIIYHTDCFSKKSILDKKSTSLDYGDIYTSLSMMGEKTSIYDIIKFSKDNNIESIDQFYNLWFLKRDKFG